MTAILITLGITLGALLAMGGLIGWQIAGLRSGRIVAFGNGDLRDSLQIRLDRFYFGFLLFFRHLVHHAYFYTLLILRRLTIIGRYLLVRVEKKFSRLIDSVRGKGVIRKRGSVSFFLQQIKDHKDDAVTRLKVD